MVASCAPLLILLANAQLWTVIDGGACGGDRHLKSLLTLQHMHRYLALARDTEIGAGFLLRHPKLRQALVADHVK